MDHKLAPVVVCTHCKDSRPAGMVSYAKVGRYVFCTPQCVTAFFSRPPKWFRWEKGGVRYPKAYFGGYGEFEGCEECGDEKLHDLFHLVDVPYDSVLNIDYHNSWYCSPACLVSAFSRDVVCFDNHLEHTDWYDPFHLWNSEEDTPSPWTGTTSTL